MTDPVLQAALQLVNAGRLEEAMPRLAQVLARDPDQPQALRAMMYVHAVRGRYAEALACAARALARTPADPHLLYRTGQVRTLAGDPAGAIECYQRALAADPTHLESHQALSNQFFVGVFYDEAIARAEAGLRIHRTDPGLIQNRAAALTQSGRAREAMEALKAATKMHPRNAVLAGALATTTNYTLPPGAPAEALELHKRHAALLAPVPPLLPALKAKDPDRVLRVGLLSADLRRHSVTRFIEPFFELGAGFQTLVYSVTPYEDAESERLRAKAALWRRVGHLPPAELARQIRADRVDILIETSGLTEGHRLAAMRYRPAPVQITAIGYPATTGVPEIDYRLVDSITDPPGLSEGQMTEQPLRLDPCFLCFAPPGAGEAPEPKLFEVRDSKSEFVFGSFSALSKLDDATVRLWSSVLREVPNSRLVIKALALREASVRARVAKRFAEAGADPARVEIREPQAGLVEHLESYRDLDVALDTYPYCGTTTTCEALSMGVPVLTLAGTTHASRVGASLMSAVGLPEFVAATPEEFVSIAGTLSADRARLGANRAGLRERLLGSVLCNRAAYAGRLGAALRECWRRACDG